MREYPQHGSVFLAGHRVCWEIRPGRLVVLEAGHELVLWRAARHFRRMVPADWIARPIEAEPGRWVGILLQSANR